jgi:hypothetical protein
MTARATVNRRQAGAIKEDVVSIKPYSFDGKFAPSPNAFKI